MRARLLQSFTCTQAAVVRGDIAGFRAKGLEIKTYRNTAGIRQERHPEFKTLR